MFYLGKPDFQKITDVLHEMEKEEMKVPEPVFNFTDEEAKEALKTELEWLSNTGVVKGLTDEDIREIENTTKVGYAGYNSRIFFEDGKWIPYSESENPQMVRVNALCSFSLKGIQIPTEDVVITETEANIGSQDGDVVFVVLGIVIAILAAIGVVVIWAWRRW